MVADDDHTVRIVLGAPQASLLTKTLERSSGRAMTIVSRRALEELGESQYGLTPFGTGPFRVAAHSMGQSVVLERFADYYDPERPKLDKVTITPIIDAEPLAPAIEAGEIQLIGGNPIAPEIFDRLLESPDLIVSIVPGPTFQSVWMNPWREPFMVSDCNKPLGELMQEKGFKVRLASAKALDRERYIEQAQFGRGTPAYGTVNPAQAFFFDPGLGESSNQRFDLEEARRLLAEAGYPDGEGIPPLKILHIPDQRREVQVIANILKTNFGVVIEPDTKDFPVLIDEFDKMNFDLCRLGSGGDYDPDDALVDWMQTTSKFNGRLREKDKMPFGNFSDARVDELVEQQRLETNPDKRKALVQEANKITSDKVASAFVFHQMDILVHHNTVNFPPESRVPGLVDLDRTTVS
jgi:peptide/nickel transport system substrate-binding protein